MDDIGHHLVSGYLLPGDTVHIIAPSSPGKDEMLPLIKKYVESLGLIPYISDHIYDHTTLLYSNNEEFRAEDLIAALTDNSKAVWCIRGGSGATFLIPWLEERLPQELPQKIFIGYSDITSLHEYVYNRYNWSTIHGPMLEWIVEGDHRDSESTKNLENLLLGKQTCITFKNLTILNGDKWKANEEIKSSVVGGNLTLVENSTGTGWHLDTSNKILFLEDVNGGAYAIDRSLEHIKQAGLFDNVCAVVFGDFVDIKDQQNLSKVLKKFAEQANFPVFSMTGIGHGSVNYPLPLNTSATISRHGREYQLIVNNIFG